MVKAVDLFSGAGGFTESARRAGIEVVWAANHSRLACDVHGRNHPETPNECQDLQQADWHKVPAMDLILASPACQGHSNAASRGGDGRRGTAPRHDAMRSTAWAVVSCMEVHRPEAVIVENVPEFMSWVLYPSWLSALHALGYATSVKVLDAADCGVPQNRRRMFLTAVRGSASLELVEPSAPHVPFASCLDPNATGWAPVSRKTANVQARVASGRKKFPRGMFLTQHVTNHPGRSLDRPIGTVTTKWQWGVVREGPDGDESRMLNVLEHKRAMSFPEEYVLAPTKKESILLLGNAVPPLLGRYVISEVVRQLKGERQGAVA